MNYFIEYAISHCKNQNPKVCEKCLLYATCYEYFTGDKFEEEREENENEI